MTDFVNSAKSGLGSFFSGVGDVAGSAWSGISNGMGALGNMFSSGTQPSSGTPDSSGALLSQGATELPDIGSGGGGADMSAMSFSGPLGDGAADYGDITASDALSQALSAMSGKTGGADGVTATGGGGFDWGSLVKDALQIGTLGMSLYNGMQEPEEINALQGLAGDAAQRSAVMNANAQNALMGNLPGGAQASVDQALEAARARIRSNYASLGMTGSTPEAQDLAYAEIAASAAAFDIGQGMAQTGFSAAAGADSLAASLYQAILASETARGTALGDALAEFAAGMVDSDVTLNDGTP